MPISVHIYAYLFILKTSVNICTYVCICLYRQYLSISFNICPSVYICTNVCICKYLAKSNNTFISVHKMYSVHMCKYLLVSVCIRSTGVQTCGMLRSAMGRSSSRPSRLPALSRASSAMAAARAHLIVWCQVRTSPLLGPGR